MYLARHGDVIIRQVTEIPQEAKKENHLTLALGEITGHSHRIEDSAAALFKYNDKMYLRVQSDLGFLRHEEHKEIQIPKGDYEIIIQRDYTPKGWEKVID